MTAACQSDLRRPHHYCHHFSRSIGKQPRPPQGWWREEVKAIQYQYITSCREFGVRCSMWEALSALPSSSPRRYHVSIIHIKVVPFGKATADTGLDHHRLSRDLRCSELRIGTWSSSSKGSVDGWGEGGKSFNAEFLVCLRVPTSAEEVLIIGVLCYANCVTWQSMCVSARTGLACFETILPTFVSGRCAYRWETSCALEKCW